MSRIGNRVLTIPENTSIILDTNNFLTITGPKGSLNKTLPKNININFDKEKNVIITTRPDDKKQNKQLHGTTNSLINGMLIGVSKGFMKELEINGVGYRAAVQGNILNLNLGFSHPVKFEIPLGITIVAPKPTILQINGIDKQLVGEVAAQIRAYRTPEPYKGKGIKYKTEHIRRKEGKAAGKGK
ncbi:50S ribosomal protein L6 [Spiroplasma endosymbiont of Virgichneumon dumeticola]|uniref:50S ribosomal protein L6 n=1 Tax=Spiroplasma endosymbiont of Virgichneumon dumeticola TaxID=3139323 RepID=UPI0035C8AADF